MYGAYELNQSMGTNCSHTPVHLPPPSPFKCKQKRAIREQEIAKKKNHRAEADSGVCFVVLVTLILLMMVMIAGSGNEYI